MKTIDYYIEEIKQERSVQRSINHERYMLELYERYPELKKMDSEIIVQRSNKIVGILDGDNESSRAADIIKSRLEISKAEYLAKNNINSNYEDELPICDKCNDTGYVSGNQGHRKVCKCMNEAKEACYKTSGLENFTLITTKNYDEDYCKNKARRKEAVLKLTKVYQHKITDRNNIWLYIDGIQTGKTYVSVLLAKQIIGLGDSCAYIKLEDIQDMSENVETNCFGSDMLFIDDFTSSLTTSGNIGSILNNILEIRSGKNLPTVIVTNESTNELLAESDVRIAGKLKFAERILDK